MRRKAEAVGVGRGWKEEMNAERLDLDRQAYAQRPHNERAEEVGRTRHVAGSEGEGPE